MSNNETFFTDPKVYIALFALLVSIITFVFSVSNQYDQNSKWEKLNEPNIDLKENKFQNWNEISKEDALKLNWGYKPTLYQKNGSFNLYILPYYLILKDQKTNQRVANTNIAFTVNEAIKELERIKYDIKKNPVFLNKLFRASFAIENLGKTIAKNISIKVSAKEPIGQFKEIFVSNTKINLSPNQTSSILIDIEYGIQIDLPENISFKLNIEWENSNGKIFTKEIFLKWLQQDNSWAFGN